MYNVLENYVSAVDFFNGQKYEIVKKISAGIQFLNTDYDCDENQLFIDKSYAFLAEKDKYHADEYLYLCWLSLYKSKPPLVNQPLLPSFLEYEFSDFQTEFSFNIHRAKLIGVVISFVESLKIITSEKDITVLFGGSFVDINKPNPNDIDIAILLPAKFLKDYKVTLLHSKQLDKHVDSKFLPIDYKPCIYYAYSELIYLGNIPQIDNEKSKILNNTFTQRQVLSISM